MNSQKQGRMMKLRLRPDTVEHPDDPQKTVMMSTFMATGKVPVVRDNSRCPGGILFLMRIAPGKRMMSSSIQEHGEGC